MATRTVKARVELDGERQYKQALSELSKGSQVLGSEMRKLQAEYKGNTDSTEYLTKKGELLERQLLQQKDRVETLRQALQNAASKYGESSEKTQEWQIKLNNAEAAQYDLQHAIEENNDALNDQGQAMEKTDDTSHGLSLSVKDLASQFGINLPGGLDKSLAGMRGFSAGSVAAVGAVAAAVKLLIDAEKKLIDLTREAAATADEILTLSQVTGLDSDTIQEMRYAANLIDVSFDVIRSSMTRLKNGMQDARNGNERLAESFRSLGVNVTNADGSLRDAEAVFYDVVDALGDIENATERDAIAMDIFGRSAEDLNPLIIAGSDTLRAYADEARAVNAVLNEESLEALQHVDDAYQRLQATQEAIRNQMAVEMAPAVEELYTQWDSYIQTVAAELKNSGIIEGAAEILKSVVDIIPALEELTRSVFPELGQGLSGIAAILETVAWLTASIADAVDFIEGFTTLDFGLMGNALGLNYDEGTPSHVQSWELKTSPGSWDAYQSRYNGGTYEGWTYNQATGQYGTDYTGYATAGGWSAEDEARYTWDPDSERWYDNVERRWIRGNAAGTPNWRGGLTWVGENGPELVDLPAGSQVFNAQDSRRAGGDVFNITIPARDIKEFNDIVRIAESARIVARMGG